MPTLKNFSIIGTVGNLEGITHLPDSAPLAIAVVAHPLPTMEGTMEHKVVTTLAKTFAELGFVALRFNFRGVGASEGVYDHGNGETEDAIAVAHYALHEYGELPLILSGFSFGGYVQARAAQSLHPQRMVLVAPAVGRFAMPDVPADTLVIQGDQDDVVLLDQVMEWARPQHLPIVIVPGTGHFFHGRLHDLKEIVRHNFMEHPLP
ncbi:MAG: alpha/beta hydrolase [Gallionellaceae bacterium]|nr:alpha/beta hydrolase [Gallionellaceae bacterium]